MGIRDGQRASSREREREREKQNEDCDATLATKIT
jgi:hypothetical protein